MVDRIRQIVSEGEFREEIISFLMDICRVDTTAQPDVRLMAENEQRVYEIIKNKLGEFSFENATVLKKKISPSIKDHPSFSKLHFTKSESFPEGLDAEVVYSDRYNLLYFIDGHPSGSGQNTAINAHIDVVSPFFPPVRSREMILGRGIIDDKGSVASICGALKVLDRLILEKRISLKNKITAMFVVEEESGGNGSLDLAVDKDLKKRYDSVLVMECAGNKVYPANRGAVWFRCEVALKEGVAVSPKQTGPSPIEGMIFSILEMQQEGDAIKEESDHPLFPHRPVQTCNGILGPFGEHPSRICAYVSFRIKGVEDAAQYFEIMTLLQKGISLYTGKYGDKTRYFDKVTGKPRVKKHCDTGYDPENKTMLIKVYGSAGHMGSLAEHDAAITKWAFMAREVFIYKIASGLDLEMELENFDSSGEIILEGGQGFLPTHSIGEIEERMRNAFIRGVKIYLGLTGSDEDSLKCKVTCDKLHNNAYYSSPDSTSFKNARESAILAGITDRSEPVRGWDASCDARLFAGEYPDMPVITGGPGELRYAHADNEQLFLPDLFNSIVFTTLFLLRETGSLNFTPMIRRLTT
jgi:acetylornithine deacetylase/succinyl-diaminopimelate desuccinylase-like protein